ncbi:PREDICTED: 30S ribosomal protein S16-1, chloroplastic [Tarenaya hassleriana]|uniref:30S ribosomal protein S16-1, chloroplastic n=1 Tax=Tarenaya hassleriana TaxID=28532 RepID=UPI00053C225E|nr:PREDICTED: 30S ribosomal protein S16-1, chloroplastic [Tarenaya hassleriana]
MAVKIRFMRFGCKNRPFFRIVTADSKSRRDGKQIEVLGFFDPLQGKEEGKRVSLKYDRVKYWLSVGAQPTDPVERILFRAGLLPPPSMVVVSSKKGPFGTNPDEPTTGQALN